VEKTSEISNVYIGVPIRFIGQNNKNIKINTYKKNIFHHWIFQCKLLLLLPITSHNDKGAMVALVPPARCVVSFSIKALLLYYNIDTEKGIEVE